jgi:hypothetical protein
MRHAAIGTRSARSLYSAPDPHFLIAPFGIRNRSNSIKTKDRHVF